MATGVTGVFGCYELRGLLGRGGMGEVHRAFDTRRGREVALKLLPDNPVDDPTVVERFRREARALVGLSDPHIVPVHDFGEIDGRLFIDMALIDGRDLANVLASRGPLSPASALRVLGQASRALDTAHRQGIVHRDVKPSNLLILEDHDDFTYLVDFGIAHTTAHTGLTGTGIVGTLAYIAPEQVRGQRVDPRTDVYSLTCVLFEMLTGRPPFTVNGPVALMNAHLSSAPPQVTRYRTDLSPEWDEVIARGMAKEPAARPASVDALYEMAGAVLRDRIPAPRQPASRSATSVDPSRRAPRHPAGLIALVTATAAAAVVAVVLLVPSIGSDGPTTTPSGAPAAGAPATTVTPQSTTAFRSFRDPGWGYRVDVPEALSGQETLADGVRFTGSGTPTILQVTARVRPAGNSSSLLADAVGEATAGGGRLTYSDNDGDAYTASGLDASGTIFYLHAEMSDSAVVTTSWSYPVSEKALWDTAVTRSTKSLTFD